MTQLGAYPLDSVQHCDALTLLRGLPDGCIDLAVTSPPYDKLRAYNGYTFDFEPIARESYRVMKPGGVLVWVVGDSVVNGSETLTSFRQALYFVDECGFRMHDTMIWEKTTNPFSCTNRYYQLTEFMFVFSKGAPATVNLIQEATASNRARYSSSFRQKDGTRKPIRYASGNGSKAMGNIWRIAAGYLQSTKDKFAFAHPAMFPEKLAERHILTWSNPGDVVLDFFAGSCTTLKMAKLNNRRFLGCDISAEYVELGKRRLSQPFTPKMFSDGLPTAEASQVSYDKTGKVQSSSQLSLLPLPTEIVEKA